MTSGSTVNVVVKFVPYNFNSNGVAVQPRQVQVTKLAEYKKRSLFKVIEGGYVAEKEGFASSLDKVEAAVEVAETEVDDEEIVEMDDSEISKAIEELDFENKKAS